MANKLIDLCGKRFGNWTVLFRSSAPGNHPVMWRCKCDCGVERDVSGDALRSGKSTFCGKCNKNKSPLLLRRHTNRLYHTWSEMRRRCNGNATNKAYYKGKGISYCSEWEDFDVFVDWAIRSGYKDGLEIDRIDGDKEYSPENCRWTTHKKNSRNRKARKNNTTGVAGVYERLRKDGVIVYRASIATDKGKINLGTFYTLEDATAARKATELKYWGFNIVE